MFFLRKYTWYINYSLIKGRSSVFVGLTFSSSSSTTLSIFLVKALTQFQRSSSRIFSFNYVRIAEVMEHAQLVIVYIPADTLVNWDLCFQFCLVLSKPFTFCFSSFCSCNIGRIFFLLVLSVVYLKYTGVYESMCVL